MKITQLEILTDTLMPKFYNFAYALVGDKDIAEQVVVDAYTVFIINEKKFIQKIEFESEAVNRIPVKKYLLNEMIKTIFNHVKNREKVLSVNSVDKYEYTDFYEMKLIYRAAIYLKEIAEFDAKEIQEVFGLKKHQVIELIHNAKNCLGMNIKNDLNTQEVFQ